MSPHTGARDPSAEHHARGRAPVFVVGAPRSGTTLLYHMLLSAGDFVHLRTETHVFSTLAPRFGQMRTARDVEGATAVWMASDCHALSGLTADEARAALAVGVQTPGDFLRALMDAMARRQGRRRWAESTPANALHMREIKAQLPDALFVHVIRDGRDVATSLAQQGWVRPLPGDGDRPAIGAAAFWRWMVERGRDQGAALGADYTEVHYESLVDAPEATLASLGAFLAHRLDWSEIQRAGIGSVRTPNTSFPGKSGSFQGRWRELEPSLARSVDSLLAPVLRRCGYESDAPHAPIALQLRAAAYTARFAVRDWVKRSTPLGRRSTDLGFFVPGAMSVTADKLPAPSPSDA